MLRSSPFAGRSPPSGLDRQNIFCNARHLSFVRVSCAVLTSMPPSLECSASPRWPRVEELEPPARASRWTENSALASACSRSRVGLCESKLNPYQCLLRSLQSLWPCGQVRSRRGQVSLRNQKCVRSVSWLIIPHYQSDTWRSFVDSCSVTLLSCVYLFRCAACTSLHSRQLWRLLVRNSPRGPATFAELQFVHGPCLKRTLMDAHLENSQLERVISLLTVNG